MNRELWEEALGELSPAYVAEANEAPQRRARGRARAWRAALACLLAALFLLPLAFLPRMIPADRGQTNSGNEAGSDAPSSAPEQFRLGETVEHYGLYLGDRRLLWTLRYESRTERTLSFTLTVLKGTVELNWLTVGYRTADGKRERFYTATDGSETDGTLLEGLLSFVIDGVSVSSAEYPGYALLKEGEYSVTADFSGFAAQVDEMEPIQTTLGTFLL